MGLFGGHKMKKEMDTKKSDSIPVPAEKEVPKSPQSSETNPVIRFYNDCVEDYHKTAMAKGFAQHGLIFIPELLSIGERTVLAFLRDPFYQMQFGRNPQLYYYVITSLSLQAGIVFASQWHSDYDTLKNGYVDEIIDEGPADACQPFLIAMMGLFDSEMQNEFFRAIFERWLEKHEPYWKMQDPREYTFRATLAAFQLGVSIALAKFGY